MRILVLGNNYAPERSSVGPFTTGLCEHLAAKGHRVTVITARPSYPEWKTWEGYRGVVYRRERLNGVTVHRVWHFVPSRPSSFVLRLFHDLSFTLAAFLAGLLVGDFDVIYCSSPPPTLGLTAYVLGKIHRKPYIMKLTDLASDAALATAILKEGWLVQIARGLERFVYSKAQKVVCLCQGFADKLVSLGIPQGKLLVIPDWAHKLTVHPTEDAVGFRNAHNLSTHQFLVLHSGNMGKKQDLINVVRAAALCQTSPEIVWLLVGNGEEKTLLSEEVSRQNLKNIKLLPFQPAERLTEMYSAADVLLLNQKASVRDAVIPSKLLTYMAAERAVIAAVNESSEAARVVRAAQCGLVIPPERPDALVGAVLAVRESVATRQELGRNGRRFADLNFTKQMVLEKYDDIFDLDIAKRTANPDRSKEPAAAQ